jgi:hypothetical protein
MKIRATLALPMLVFGLLFASDACAYLDPGTGSILLQGLIAATAAVVTWASLTWRQTKAWLRSHFGRKDEDGHDDTEAKR